MKKSKRKSIIKDKESFISAGIPNVSPAEAHEMCRSGAVIIDIRGEYITAFKKFDVPEVLYFPEAGRQSTGFDNLDRDRTYIVAETSTSLKSREIVRKLINNGYQSVYNLAGGFVEWERDDFPVLENKEARLSGSCMCQLKPRNKHQSGSQHDEGKQ